MIINVHVEIRKGAHYERYLEASKLEHTFSIYTSYLPNFCFDIACNIYGNYFNYVSISHDK
jgi:hypothetical protein